MLPLVALTHVTTRSFESMDSFIWIFAHKHSSMWLWYPTQNFRSSTAVDHVCNNLSPLVHAISIKPPIDAYWVKRLLNLSNLIGVTYKTSKMWIRVFLLHLAMLDSSPKHFTSFQALFKICKNQFLIGRALKFLNYSFYSSTVLESWFG